MQPSSTTSGAAPPGQAMTGVPQASDSSITRPKGSFQRIGKSVARAPASSLTFSSWVTSATYSTASPSRGSTSYSKNVCSQGSLSLPASLIGMSALRAATMARWAPFSGAIRPRYTT